MGINIIFGTKFTIKKLLLYHFKSFDTTFAQLPSCWGPRSKNTLLFNLMIKCKTTVVNIRKYILCTFTSLAHDEPTPVVSDGCPINQSASLSGQNMTGTKVSG